MAATLHRPVCDLLGCRYPIVLAGMGGVARSELVTAVSQAGGFGFLGMVREPVDLIRSEVTALRNSGIERFGVNLIPAATEPALLEAQLAACIELDVPVIGLFWDVSSKLIARLRAARMTVVCQVGSVAEAQAAEQAGAQVVIAQGVEAGGHVRGDRPLLDLVPEIVAATELPVLAAGGLADGADLATVLALGTQGAVFGTALIATPESFAHDYHKRRLVEADGDDTVLTNAFHINWPRGAKVRVLANSVTGCARGDPYSRIRTIIGDENGRPIYLFSTDSPLRSMTGAFEAMALYAGKGVGRVTSSVGAGERISAIAAEALTLLDARAAAPDEAVELASPSCLARESDDLYMGFAPRHELLGILNEMLETERAGARVTLHAVTEAPDELKERLRSALQAQTRWCGVLTNAIYRLRGAPSRKTGALYDEAMTSLGVPARLTSVDRGQAWIVRRLTALLPTIHDETVRADLAAMLVAHERDFELGTAAGAARTSSGDQNQ